MIEINSIASISDTEIIYKHCLKALKIFKNTVGLDHLVVANTYANIAYGYQFKDEDE